MDLGLLSPELGAAIIRAAQAVADGEHDDQFVLDIFQTGSGTSTNMNANEVIAGIANEAAHAASAAANARPSQRRREHGAVVQRRDSHRDPPGGTRAVAESARSRTDRPARPPGGMAGAFDRVVKIGRTHLQDAVPIRLGQEFSGYAAQVAAWDPPAGAACRVARRSCRSAARRWARESTRTAEFPERMAAAARPGDGPARSAGVQHVRVAWPSATPRSRRPGALKTVAVSLSCIANNIRLLGSGPRCGIGEIQIPELQPGSSIMPGKVNPVIPEAVMMVAAQVVGNDATITWANALGSNFDLNVMMPVIAYNLLQSIDLLAPRPTIWPPSASMQAASLRTRRPMGWSASRPTTSAAASSSRKAWQCVPHWRPELVMILRRRSPRRLTTRTGRSARSRASW